MRATWKIINKEKGKTQSEMLVPQIVPEGKLISDQKIIANLFNNYFLSIANLITTDKNNDTKSNICNSTEYLFKHYDKPFPSIKWQYASTHEVEKILRSLKIPNSAGYDKISNRLLKLSDPYIASPLTYICNAALNLGVFPDRLKYVTVKPIHKKGNLQDLANYRQIALLTAFSKVSEKLIYTKFYTHLLDNNILTAHQFGFRAHHSTEQATFSLINSILEAMNQNVMIGGIFCDLQKAFDSVNHEIIFEKIQFYGIVGKFKMLSQSYSITNIKR